MPTKTYGAGKNVCCLIWITQKIQRWKERRTFGACLLGSQVGAVVIIHNSHHYDPGLILGSYVIDLNLTLRVFLWILRFSSLRKNKLSHQNLCHQAY